MNNRRNLLVNKSDEEFVDLGLPSGLKWAKGNLKKSGVTCVIGDETDWGDFWSWANVGLTNNWGWMSSAGGVMTQVMYNSTTGVNCNNNISGTNASYDVVYKYLGTPWRLPTQRECNELIDNTDHEFATINGVNGMKFMKKGDHSIYVFFPAPGYCYLNGLYSRGSIGTYWNSSYSTSTQACCMIIQNNYATTTGAAPRHFGRSIRPVL